MAKAEETTAGFKRLYPNAPSSEFLESESYDIVPTTAFIQGNPVFSLAASWGMRYVFTGGEDGFVRKYDFLSSINSNQLLTMSQRHMLPDTITKSGVLTAYWENEQPLFEDEYKAASDGSYVPKLSPVYSLAAQSEALWVCAGLESGGIAFQSATYGEAGQILAYLDGHTKAVSDLQLNSTEDRLLSGSWDKSVALWDLDAGVRVQHYDGLAGQVSCVAWQPLGAAPVGPAPAVPASKKDEEEDDDKSMESLFGSDDDESAEPGEAKAAGDASGDGANGDGASEPGELGSEAASKEDSTEKAPAESPSGSDAGGLDEAKNTGTVFLSATFNRTVEVWDTRQKTRSSWLAGTTAPPWCMSACWSYDGGRIYVGQRNASIDEYDIRNMEQPTRTLKFPGISGAVSSMLAMPNNKNLLCASNDNLRMYDLETDRKIPFFIIPGHHGSMVSRLLLDNSGKYLVSATGGRGWTDASVDFALGYEISAVTHS